ncbi:DUF4296 domain-containing protein [Rasiella sp. SM2506]|uniref:DUF4296 domain-containing protein n=1 Tax=Rasiella sp. SM2506 TaxID=3423914 RepID=UPI003D7A7E01
MKIVFYISLCLFFIGCQHIVKPEKPENLIPENTMVEILAEVYLGNAARSIDNTTMRRKGVKIDSFLFKKYNIDSLQFAKSNAYYAADLDMYNAIFQKIELKLQALETIEKNRKLLKDSLRNEKKRVNDSLNPKKNKVLEELDEEMDTTKTEGILIEAATSEQ